MFQRNPEKLEAKALDYERRGKTAKAAKYREKAVRLRGGNLPMSSTATTGTSTTYFNSFRTPQTYEQNALKWEQRGNWQKAQKNREKVWRLQNPQYPPTYAAPMFYDSNNRFLGYNVPHTGGFQQGGFQQGGFQQGGSQQGGFQQGIPLQQGGLMQGSTLNKGPVIQNVLPAVVETHVHPTIVQQTTRPERIVEVQPFVHREIDAPQVHVVEKHSYEQVRSTGPGVITNQPIVQETLHPRIIEEIQPVVHREVPAPFVEHVEQHVTERVVQPTTMTKDVINEGLRTGPAIAAGGPAFQPGLQQPGLQQGLNQPGLQQGLNQPGLQQPGLQQGLNQPGFQQGLAGQQGLPGQNLQQGLNRPAGFQQTTTTTTTGLNNLRR